MSQSTRRNFLKTATGLFGMALGDTAYHLGKRPLLSFSTLGCPDWTFDKIVNFASKNNYSGIELRGIKRQMDLTKCDEFSNPKKIVSAIKLLKDNGLKLVSLDSSAVLHHLNVIERQKNLEEAKRFIDLAHAVKCPYIRVFPNNLPKEQERNATIDIIIKSLLELGDYAKGSGVIVLMESHGDLIKTADLKKIMQSAEHENTGMIWDIVNMWSVTKEPPALVYGELQKYIQHTHFKDLKVINGKEQYTLFGNGEAPVFEAIDILRKGNYKGYFSFEWEKLWHPEIEEPEIALTEYPIIMREYFTSKMRK